MKTVSLGSQDAGALRPVLFAASGGSEPFLLLRRQAEASVYLGALLDAAGNVHELLEVWVQRIVGSPGTELEFAL